MKNHKCISCYLPEKTLDNDELAILYPDWTAEKIYQKTGIQKRHIASENEFASDMAIIVGNKLFKDDGLNPQDVDGLIIVTQSPDYALPTTACIVQHALGIPKSAGAFDINLGCSGYIYGLSVAKAMIESKIMHHVVLITVDTYTKYIHKMDKSVRTIFGDGATATWIDQDFAENIGSFILGTDGSGYHDLIVPSSGLKTMEYEASVAEYTDKSGNRRTPQNLYMDGAEILDFTLQTVPKMVREVLKKNHLAMEDIDRFVFHQASKLMLDYLKKVLKIPDEKFYMNIENVGNTVSSSIPIALKMASSNGLIKENDKILLAGFGVGLSWGATIINW